MQELPAPWGTRFGINSSDRGLPPAVPQETSLLPIARPPTYRSEHSSAF